jgi:hypothetical protein
MRVRLAAVFLLLSTSVFSLDLSAGLSLSGGYFLDTFNTSKSSLSVSSSLTNSSLPFRAELFFDGQYLRMGAGYKLAVLGREHETQTVSGSTSTVLSGSTGTKGYFSFSVYGKYPFAVGPVLLFPLLGIESDVNLIYLDSHGHDVRRTLTDQQLADEDQLWIKAGIGADWSFVSWGYIRGEVLLGYKFPSQSESDAADNAKSSGFDATLYTLEPSLDIAIGFKW